MKFRKFHQISWNFMEFGGIHQILVFWGPGIKKRPMSVHLEHAFKAKKVTLLGVFRLCAEMPILGYGTPFWVQIRFWGGFPALFRKECAFPDPGPQNTSFFITFIKGFGQGGQKVHLGSKSALLGAEMLKGVEFRPFSENGRAT